MPKFLEDELRRAAKKAGKTGKEADRYIYGTIQNMHVIKGNKETSKGVAMERKHEADQKKG